MADVDITTRLAGVDNVLDGLKSIVTGSEGMSSGFSLNLIAVNSAFELINKSIAITKEVVGKFYEVLGGAALKAGDELYSLAQAAGMTTEAFSKWKLVAEQANASAGDIIVAQRMLAVRLADTSEGASKAGAILQSLGITTTDTSEIMLQLSGVVSQLPDGMQKAQLMADLFSRSSTQLIATLNQGPDAIRHLMELSDQLGNTWSEDTAAAANEFYDNLHLLEIGVSGFGHAIADQTAPALSVLSGQFVDIVAKSGIFVTAGNVVGEVLKAIALTAISAVNGIQQLGTVFAGAAEIAHGFVTNGIEGATAALKINGDQVKDIQDQYTQAVARIYGSIADNKEPNKSLEELVAQVLRLQQETKEWEAVEKEWAKYNDAMLDYQVKSGEKTLDYKKKNLQEQLAQVEKGTTEEIDIRSKILDINEQIATAAIKNIKEETNVTKTEAITQLLVQLDKYQKMGESGYAAAQKVNDAIFSMVATTDKTDDAIENRNEKMMQELDSKYQAYFKQLEKYQDDLLDYDIKIGKRSVEDKRSEIEQKLAHVEQGTAEEIQLRNELLDVNDKIAQEAIKDIRDQTNVTREEALKQLLIELDKYQQMKEAGVVAANRIRDAINNMVKETEAPTKTWFQRVQDGFVSWDDVAAVTFTSFTQGFGKSVADIIVHGEGLRKSMSALFKDILDAFISMLFRMVGEWMATKAIIGANNSFGWNMPIPGVAQTAASAGAQGALSTGAQGAATAASMGSSFTGNLSAGWAAGSQGGVEAANTLAGSAPASTTMAAYAAAAAPYLLSAGAGIGINKLMGYHDTTTAAITSAIGYAIAGPIGAAIGGVVSHPVAKVGDAVAKVFGWDTGGTFTVNKPTLFMAGETGPERINVNPMGRSADGGRGSTMVFNGPVMFDQITARRFARMQYASMGAEARRYV